MSEQENRRKFNNPKAWKQFFPLWLTIGFWAAFLLYMLAIHFLRGVFEPLMMSIFDIKMTKLFFYIEIELFIDFLLLCSLISVIAILLNWNKNRRAEDAPPDKLLIITMLFAITFSAYYVAVDLNFLNGEVPLLTNFMNITIK